MHIYVQRNLYYCLKYYVHDVYIVLLVNNEMIENIIYTLPVIQRVYKAFGSAGQLTDGSSFTWVGVSSLPILTITPLGYDTYNKKYLYINIMLNEICI